MSEKSIVEQIKHYQRDIIRSPDNCKRMIRCIERLTVLPVTIAHLQETGVGRSVNELRKCGAEVGAAANALVCKWKSMVKDEEESDAESDVDEPMECKMPSSADHKKNSSRCNESPQKHKQCYNNEDDRKSVSSHKNISTHCSKNNVELPRSENKTLKCTNQKPSNKSDHRSHRDKSVKSDYNSSSDSKYSSSHRAKINHDSRSHNKPYSSHESKSDCNGSVKSDQLHAKTKHDQSKSNKYSTVLSLSGGKTKDLTQKSNRDKHKREESSYNHSKGGSKKYNQVKEESDSSDDETVYKPMNVKQKISDSEDEQEYENSMNKKLDSKEYIKKRKYDSSEESDIKSESDGENDHDSRENLESHDNSASEEEVSNRSNAEDDASDNESHSSSRSSAQESENNEAVHSGKDSDSEGDDSPEREPYIPIQIKREKESPPRHSKSYNTEKCQSNPVKSTQSSSSFSKKNQSNNVTNKKKGYENIKIKKEKIDKDDVNAHRQKESLSVDKKVNKSSSSYSESSSKQNRCDKKVKVKIEKAEDGSIGCESGASFGDALLGLSDTKKKALKRKPTTPTQPTTTQVKSPKTSEKNILNKKTSTKLESRPSSSSKKSYKELNLLSKNVKLEPLDVDLKATLPDITPNYKPLPHYSPPCSPAHKRTKLLTQEEALSTIMSTKNQRTKVYSGNKTGFTKVPSLFDLCIQVLRDNIEALEYTGGVPYDLLKPVLDRATADQLYQLEHYNPYLVEDTDILWQFHCNKDFRGKKPEEFETWRELYLRLLDEREKKLEALKANITQSMAKSTPIRQTKLAYVDSVVKPPRNVARKQMKFGTSKPVKHDLVSKPMLGEASSSPAPEAVPVPAPSRSNLSTSSFPIPNFLKKKKAPLMAKTLQLIKGNRFKR